VHGFFLIQIIGTDFHALGHLPVTLMHPPGVMEYLSWKFYDRLMTPEGMTALKCAMVLSLSMSAVGYLSTITCATSAALVILYQGILRSFGHFNHDEMVGIYFLMILAVSPCANAVAVDRAGCPAKSRSSAYGYPIFLMQAVMAWAYCTSGILKLRLGGTAWFSQDNLPVTAIQHSLDNLHDTHFHFAFLLAQYRWIVPIAAAIAVVWEILYPLALVSRAARAFYFVTGVVFHLTTMLLINITFPCQAAMYLIWVNWQYVSDRLFGTSVGKRAASWIERVSGPGEVFADERHRLPQYAQTLVWDGDCGFCGWMVGWLRRVARSPFRDERYQVIAGELSPAVLQASTGQMHWIGADGSVVGGSRALVAVLDHSGHRWIAAILGAPPFRPFTWLAYRLIALNRRRFGRFTGGTCNLS
jgi:predicted DCC family thiol-disulfide oxidoreductase YuxK